MVFDKQTGITAYAAFENYQPTADKWVYAVPAETMVMVAAEANGVLRMSVCDPNLNIAEKTYTTKEPSRPIVKEVVLNGRWTLQQPVEQVQVKQEDDRTVLTVTCQHGQPVEMLLSGN